MLYRYEELLVYVCEDWHFLELLAVNTFISTPAATPLGGVHYQIDLYRGSQLMVRGQNHPAIPGRVDTRIFFQRGNLAQPTVGAAGTLLFDLSLDFYLTPGDRIELFQLNAVNGSTIEDTWFTFREWVTG